MTVTNSQVVRARRARRGLLGSVRAQGGVPPDVRPHQPGARSRGRRSSRPSQQDMEATLAKHVGAPYAARKVSFHLPDFIDIVSNAGDDRKPLRRDDRAVPCRTGAPSPTRGAAAPSRWATSTPTPTASRPSTHAADDPLERLIAAYTSPARARAPRHDPARGDAQPRPRPRVQGRRQDRRAGLRRPARDDARGAQGADGRALLHGVPPREGDHRRRGGEERLRRRHRLGLRPHLARHDRRRGAPQAVRAARRDPDRLR